MASMTNFWMIVSRGRAIDEKPVRRRLAMIPPSFPQSAGIIVELFGAIIWRGFRTSKQCFGSLWDVSKTLHHIEPRVSLNRGLWPGSTTDLLGGGSLFTLQGAGIRLPLPVKSFQFCPGGLPRRVNSIESHIHERPAGCTILPDPRHLCRTETGRLLNMQSVVVVTVRSARRRPLGAFASLQ
jgi:hypothetical protein